MNIQRFTASTSREALAKARMAFGEGTLILSNRKTEYGVEVVATAEDSLESLDRDGGGYKQQAQQRKLEGAPRKAGSASPSYKEIASQVEDDADQLSMSTLSFQDYVRERMARRRQEAAAAQHNELPARVSTPSRRVSNFAQRAQDSAAALPPAPRMQRANPAAPAPQQAPQAAPAQRAQPAPQAMHQAMPMNTAPYPAPAHAPQQPAPYPYAEPGMAHMAPAQHPQHMQQQAQHLQHAQPQPQQQTQQHYAPVPQPQAAYGMAPTLPDYPTQAQHLQAQAMHHPAQAPAAPQRAAPVAQAQPAPPSAPNGMAMSQGIVKELHAMKDLIEDRFNTLSWLGQARQSPIQSTLMLKLIRSGYSPTLARTILERMPESADAQHAVQWIMSVLERNLHINHQPLPEEGGFFALVGATGVGKTTTVAKLAGLCAQQYGGASVGLISLDTYRVGAQEQLRAYGKMLGVVAHVAHDRAALQELLGLLSNKRMVLIDTTGLAPRDPRKREVMDLLDIPQVKRLLVLNAGGHGDTLDDTVLHFKAPQAQQVIFSKIDEAVKLGPAIDAAIRHQLTLRGVTTGQQVPEDWEAANAGKLVRASMAGAGKSPYDPKMTDLGFIFSQSSQGAGSHRLLDA